MIFERNVGIPVLKKSSDQNHLVFGYDLYIKMFGDQNTFSPHLILLLKCQK